MTDNGGKVITVTTRRSPAPTPSTKNAKKVKVTVEAVAHSGDSFMVAYGNKVECEDTKSGHECSFDEDASIVGKKIDIVDRKTLRWTQREVPHW
ncbi:MAG: hypothetical protein ACRDP6_46415 [Actinoallomurus sp.]